ncbi:signal peptidase I [Lactobacillus sp.]|uniref:signal peptidase I n=1 Tax=Lactobacillus sp. TaxID=1591 RepID=UPI003EF83937
MNKADKKQTQSSWLKELWQTAAIFLVIAGLYYFIFSQFLSNDVVSGPSMQATFQNGDRIVSVRHAAISRFDVVVLKAPDEPGALYIKRVIGMPGDKIRYQNDQLYVNGKKVSEPYLKEGKKLYSPNQQYTTDYANSRIKVDGHTITVPKGKYFVMGDHRNISKDSRLIGYIDKDAIVGLVKFRYWPITKIEWFN